MVQRVSGPQSLLSTIDVAPRRRNLFPCAVPKLRSFVKYWLPVLAMMGLIFSASSDRESAQHSSRILGPIFRWLFPHLAHKDVNALIFLTRKCAHFAEYAVLALLIWRALRKPVKNDPRPWDWSQARRSGLLVVLYAVTDELHQVFVPCRQASLGDVMIDTVGAAIALVFLWSHGRLRRQW